MRHHAPLLRRMHTCLKSVPLSIYLSIQPSLTEATMHCHTKGRQQKQILCDFTIPLLSSKGLFAAGSLSEFAAMWFQVFVSHSPSSSSQPWFAGEAGGFGLSVSACLSCKRLVDLGLDLLQVWLSCGSSSWVELVLVPSGSGGGSVLVVLRLAGSGRCLWPLITFKSRMWWAATCDCWTDQLHHSELTNGDFLVLTLLLS